MSDLPQGWVASTLGALCDPPQYGWTTSARKDGSAGLKFLRTTDISQGTLDWGSVPVCADEPLNPEHYQLASGDIVISRAGSVGLSYRLTDVVPAVFASYLIRFRPSQAVDGRYLAYYLQSRAYWSQIAAATSGITLANVNAKKLSAIELPVAPHAEQGRIVGAIEEQFSRLDTGIAALKRARQNLKRMRDAIRFAATRGQLVAQNPDDEPAADLIARVKPTGRFRGDTQLPSGLGVLPPGWSWALMGRLARRVTVGHVGPMKEEYVPEGIPFLRSQNVREDRFDARGLLFISLPFHERLMKSRLMPGDVVVVRSGNVGTACVVPAVLREANCADLVIIQAPEALDPRYASLYMNSLARSWVRAGRVGVALTHFNTQSVAELPVPVPPLAEQRRIVTEADRLMSIVDALDLALTVSVNKSAALPSAILGAAFTGKLVSQDPTDDPASKLLERIASERSSSNGYDSRTTHTTVPA